MKRRHFLIALAVVVPVAVFVPAKMVASWRPVAVGSLFDVKSTLTIPYLAASADVVFAGRKDGTVTRFDLSRGRATKRAIEGVCQGGNALWHLRDGDKPQLEIVRPNQTRVYPLSIKMALYLREAALPIEGGVFLSSVRVLDGPQELQLLVGERFCRWSQNTGQLASEFSYIEFVNSEFSALSRDGQSIVWAAYEVATYSSRDGHLIKRLQWDVDGGQQQNSPFGAYSVYRDALANRQQWIVMDTRTGQRLWSADWDLRRDLVCFSPDETLLAIGRPSLGAWHLHRTRDGVLVGTVSLVPDTVIGAFSPDNATLYSVAGSVLYRQRAR